jgi:hypothetical protein
MIERIGNAENIPDSIVSSLSYFTFGILFLYSLVCGAFGGDEPIDQNKYAMVSLWYFSVK